jgi:hypothetical protein
VPTHSRAMVWTSRDRLKPSAMILTPWGIAQARAADRAATAARFHHSYRSVSFVKKFCSGVARFTHKRADAAHF